MKINATNTFLSLSFLFLPITATMGQIPFQAMSYNVENLFDTDDNPATDDNEFLPSGPRRWTPSRYNYKLNQISRVITAAGRWDTPALIGLCEVENDAVLTHLLSRTPLQAQDYRYCLAQNPDRRGIRVALLYRQDKFQHIGHRSVQIRFKSGARPTRDILHVWGEIESGDTLDVLVCHFPSKYGGEKETESLRMEAASTLKRLCDSLVHTRRNPLQIIMGDFNDSPESACMKHIATAPHLNLFANLPSSSPRGSQKYRDEWSQLDQILIHRRMNAREATLQYVPESARTFSPPFLFTSDKTWKGKRPRRTYYGYKYEAGYSDHLPVLADFVIIKK
jgi:endonuclease/exonuclease/phosphatase family metal-dependent hydrolase